MTAAPPQVAVLMATYNGAEFLPQQLDSLAAQTHESWRLWVSDDGSTDATLDILHRYQKAWGQDKMSILAGPRRGFQANFLALTAQPDISADYYAWSDQDDVWLPAKLNRAVNSLATYSQEWPALYCGRTILTDRDGRDRGFSPLMNRRLLGFTNALVQCVAGGNTMVFNRSARDLIIDGSSPASHDWWAYQVVSGCGGLVFYDPEPMVRYRQHRANFYGQNRGLIARWSRLKKLFSGALKQYMDLNLASIQKFNSFLTPDSRRSLEALTALRQSRNPLNRLNRFRAAGFHRQTGLEQMAVYLAVLFDQI